MLGPGYMDRKNVVSKCQHYVQYVSTEKKEFQSHHMRNVNDTAVKGKLSTQSKDSNKTGV